MWSRVPTALFAVPELVYSVVLAVSGETWVYLILAALVAAHAITHLLPWRVPRDDRTPFGYWAEALVCTSPLVAAAVIWLVFPVHGTWAALPSSLPVWSGVASIGAAALIWLSGIRLAGLRTGDLAFLVGPLPVHEVAARTMMTVISVVAEEVVYRGIPAGITSYRTVALVCAAVAFVSNHHMIRGGEVRLRPRILCFEASASVIFGGLVLLSGSIWPAVAAHAVANVPHVTLDIQRIRCDRVESSQVNEVQV
jgi:membrane protease YdiL (CAAX protease family)